jgi:hypothetical protein
MTISACIVLVKTLTCLVVATSYLIIDSTQHNKVQYLEFLRIIIKHNDKPCVMRLGLTLALLQIRYINSKIITAFCLKKSNYFNTIIK